MKLLKVGEKQKTSYCIQTWLRDEQIKSALRRDVGRIKPGDATAEPIAVVGYGPSLNDTWQFIKQFKKVITCSGAHKFLVDKGIIPTYHLEVDPRAHKVDLIGPPQNETEYLIASTCHPKVFDHLQGYNVKLWHVFDSTAEGKRLLPAGEWQVTGGCDAGLRAITMASFLGYRDLHVFGIDGSGRKEKHASTHPNKLRKEQFAKVEYPEGSKIFYRTTGGMLEAARQLWHELDQIPEVKTTFYGGGLIQAMAVNYKPQPKPAENIVAFSKPELISTEYRDMNAKLHIQNLAFGVGGGKHVEVVKKLTDQLKTTSVLDYGCGKGYLGKGLPFPIWEYDPAIPEKSEAPRAADIVVCTDVLEHIEPEKLAFVLDDLRRCVRKVGYFVIHTGPSMKTLPDGRNTHLIQQGETWWREKLGHFFDIGKVDQRGYELYVVVGKKAQNKVSVRKAA
jgi:uncharacterized Rossmann fold enzyme